MNGIKIPFKKFQKEANNFYLHKPSQYGDLTSFLDKIVKQKLQRKTKEREESRKGGMKEKLKELKDIKDQKKQVY